MLCMRKCGRTKLTRTFNVQIITAKMLAILIAIPEVETAPMNDIGHNRLEVARTLTTAGLATLTRDEVVAPCQDLPGSPERVARMALRAHYGASLFHPADRVYDVVVPCDRDRTISLSDIMQNKATIDSMYSIERERL